MHSLQYLGITNYMWACSIQTMFCSCNYYLILYDFIWIYLATLILVHSVSSVPDVVIYKYVE